MKKMIFLMLVFFMGMTASMNAQVTIGSNGEPTPGAVLDLQSGGSLGLLMPSVVLTDALLWAPVEGSAVEGMTVFNTSEVLTNGLTGKGIYVWSNKSWNRLGASAIACEAINGSATQNGSFTGDIGAGQTLEVTLSAGSAPYNYTWYKEGTVTPVRTTTNSSGYKDSYLATEYGSYTCEITNACTSVLKVINFEISPLNPGDYSEIPLSDVTISLGGVTCFDVTSSLVADSDYPLSVTGSGLQSLDKVTWVITETKAVQSASATTGTTNAQLHFKSQPAVSGLAPAEITVTAYIDLTLTGSTTAKRSVSKTVKFQNQSCCATGMIIPSGVWTGPTTTTAFASGANAATVQAAFVQTSASLCLASTDEGVSITWNTASQTTCANSTKDGQPAGSWRLPNIAELSQLQGSQTSYGMQSGYYWSSTERDGSNAWYWFYSASIAAYVNKTSSLTYLGVRCVRSL